MFETPGAAQALSAGDPAPFKLSRRYRFKRKATASCDVFSMYGLPATASNASVDDEAAAETSDVGEADQVDSDSEEDLQAAAIPFAKAYFDPSQGCYVKALEGGKRQVRSWRVEGRSSWVLHGSLPRRRAI